MSHIQFQPSDLDLLQDRRWRLHNLYYILDKDGNRALFKPNWAQDLFLQNMHTRNIILKARQLGFSTLIDIMLLDACLFNSNVACTIVDKTIDDAKAKLAGKVMFAYDNLHEEFRKAVPLAQRNAESVRFANGSSIDVGTSARGGTKQWMHTSELGAIAARSPQKAREIKTGAFPAVATNGFIAVESTAEGKEGVFYDLCEESRAHVGELSPLDFKFHFFPWWMNDEYQLSKPVPIPDRLHKYFEMLAAEGLKLTDGQKWWYTRMEANMKDDMKREFPSFPDEAFEASMEGTFFSRYMADANEQGRIGLYPYNPKYPVSTFWDIGRRDNTAIWFVQFINGWVYLIDHHEMSGQQIKYFADYVHAKEYYYAQHWFPHDIRAETWGMESTRIEQLVRYGIEPDIVPNLSNQDQLESAYEIFPRCRFNEQPTIQGRKCLRAFKKEWDEKVGVWKKDYLHDWSSDSAKAFMYLGVVYKQEAVKVDKVSKPLTQPSLATEQFQQLMISKDKPTWQQKRI